MNKILIVAKNVFLTRILKPTYYWMIIAPILLLVGVFFFNQYITQQHNDKQPIIAVVAPEGVKQALSSNKNKNYKIAKTTDFKMAKRSMIDGPIDGILYIKSDFKNAKFIYNNHSQASMPVKELQADVNSVHSMMTAQKLGLSNNQIKNLFKNIKLKDVTYNSSTKKEQPLYNGYSSTQLFSESATFLMFLLLTSYISIAGVEIGREKGDHILESIVAAIPPKEHFAGKMLGILYLITFQLSIYAGLVIIGKIILTLLGKQKWIAIFRVQGITAQYVCITVMLMLGSVFLYVLLATMLASFVSRSEDISQATTIVASGMVIPYFISFLTQDAPNNSLSVIFSYLPFMSQEIMPIRIAVYAASYIDGWIAVGISIITVIVMYVATEKVYCNNIFNYSDAKPLRAFFSSIKKQPIE